MSTRRLYMKKVGIMSMQRIRNYGSFMQAYGLKKNIEKLGYEVHFADYNYEGSISENDKKRNFIKKILNNLNIIKFIKKRKYIKKFETMYVHSIKKYLNIDNTKKYLYDTIEELVIGSDEVFNCTQEYPVGYSRELFGKNYEDIPVISYAACFGNTKFSDIEKYQINEELSNMLNKFKSISVRDENSYTIIKKLTGKLPSLNFDPVLITDFSDEIVDNVKISNYILIYAYSGRLSKQEEKYIKKFAKRNNKKIVSIGGYQRIVDYNIIVDPFEVFSYFKHADFIITDTFHGSIFAIKVHTKFATIIRNGNTGNNNKLVDLLIRLERTDRIVKELTDIDKLYKSDIDYSNADKIIEEETKKSIKYLKENLIK